MNQTMPEADHCPQCGTPLSPGGLAGLCPACLLKAGAAADTITDAKPSSFNPPAISELAPKFPQLEILELIGKGGMGAVYKARQKQLDRIVALKILPPDIGSEAAFAERFTREARALAKLNHPNIVTLYEFGETSGQFYFLMEFVDGLNLRQLLNNSRISPREALAIVPQICDALQFAHDHGIVHRDIKPENILLDRHGRVKVADFGLAKIVAIAEAACDRRAPKSGTPQPSPAIASENLTDAGKVMGTPKYMSPEQVTNPGEVDHRADIYALGVVFYQMLTGELPGKKIEPPSKKVQIDVRLDEIVLRALERKPELRFQQASVLKTQVETIVETPPSAKIVPPLIQNPNQFLRWFAVTTLAMIVVIFLIAILGLIAAVGIPNFIKVREQSLARNQLAVKTANPDETTTNFYIGQAYFPQGDSIEITSVERTEHKIIVKGHYNLVSTDHASLALHITTSEPMHSKEDASQSMAIVKGQGDFELIHSHAMPGMPHVNMHSDGRSFAELYFGTEAEAARESSLNLTNQQPPPNAGALGNTNVIGAAVVSVSPANGATNVDWQQTLRIRFNQPIDPNDFEMDWQTGGFLTIDLPDYVPNRNEFVLPVRLFPGQTNKVAINTFSTRGFRDMHGVLAEKYGWSFITRPPMREPGAPIPKVIRISPSPAETLPVLTLLEITFDQPMMPPNQSLPYLEKLGINDFMSLPALIPCVDYDAPSHRFTIPVLLPPDNDTKLKLEGFTSAAGVPSDPVIIRCQVGTNNYSSRQMDETAAAKDPQLEKILSSAQQARAQLTSGLETVQWISTSAGTSAFIHIMANSLNFRWQGTNQIYADISKIMNSKAFILGSDGKTCWMYSDDQFNGGILNRSPVALMSKINATIADPFDLTQQTVPSAIAKMRLICEGQTPLDGRPCYRIQNWSVRQPQDRYDYVFVARTEWWLDAETFLPVQIVQYNTTGFEMYRFHYEKLNQPLPDSAFAPPVEKGAMPKAVDWFKPKPDPGEQRFLTIKDGSDAQMSGRFGIQGPNGTTTSAGLN